MQQTNILIDSQNICRHGNDTCLHNGKNICYQCQIFSGNSNVPVRFTPALKSSIVDQGIDQKKIIIQLPPIQEEVKVVPSSEEDLDEGTFVYFVAPTTLHSQSGHLKFHRHYLVNQRWFGTYCFLCGGVSASDEYICGFCSSMFNLEHCFVPADKIYFILQITVLDTFENIFT